jgi:disulfide bond formation protein DsbB
MVMTSTLVQSARARPLAVAAAIVAVGGAATILGAWFFQYGLGLPPCPLCLEQRIPYYVAIAIAALVALGGALRLPSWLRVAGLAVAGLAMLIGAGLGLYHAGVEWQWWQGPLDCSGPLGDLGPAAGLAERLKTITIVRCDEAAWRFLGLSLAGYNVLISLALAAVALWGLAVGRDAG